MVVTRRCLYLVFLSFWDLCLHRSCQAPWGSGLHRSCQLLWNSYARRCGVVAVWLLVIFLTSESYLAASCAKSIPPISSLVLVRQLHGPCVVWASCALALYLLWGCVSFQFLAIQLCCETLVFALIRSNGDVWHSSSAGYVLLFLGSTSHIFCPLTALNDSALVRSMHSTS